MPRDDDARLIEELETAKDELQVSMKRMRRLLRDYRTAVAPASKEASPQKPAFRFDR